MNESTTAAAIISTVAAKYHYNGFFSLHLQLQLLSFPLWLPSITTMASSLYICSCSSSSKSINMGFRHPPSKPSQQRISINVGLTNFLFPCPPNLRPNIAGILLGRKRLVAGFSANSNPPEDNSVVQKSSGVKTGDDSSAQGPPFLTILAALIVFFLLFWGFGSILLWLFSLVVNVPPSK